MKGNGQAAKFQRASAANPYLHQVIYPPAVESTDPLLLQSIPPEPVIVLPAPHPTAVVPGWEEACEKEVSLNLFQHGNNVADGLDAKLNREQPLANMLDTSKSIGVDDLDHGIGGARRRKKPQKRSLELVDSAVQDAKGRRAGKGGLDFVLREQSRR